MAVWVTVSILAGKNDDDHSVTNIPIKQCGDAREAVDAIKLHGCAAWFNTDEWDGLVFDTLVGLGNSPECARREIHMARTGVLLPEEAFVE